MEFGPAAKDEVVLNAVVPKEVTPSKNSTLPLASDNVELIVTAKVIGGPKRDALLSEATQLMTKPGLLLITTTTINPSTTNYTR